MTEEIKKLIEEEAERYADSKGIYNQHGEALLKMGFKKGANFILSKWREVERWRKVGEHRPAVDEHLMYSYTCLVRLESGAYAIAVYHSCGAWMESGTEEYLDTVIEWKPIS